MASIEYIQKRVEGKEKEIAKLEKKMERILKAQATGWEVNPYWYHEDDLKWTARDIERAKATLEKYMADLKTATEKANSRNVTAILEFLEMWKKQVSKFYHKTFENYPEAYEQHIEEMKQYKLSYFEERKLKKENEDEYNRYKSAKKAAVSGFATRYGFLQPYIERTWVDSNTYKWLFDDEKFQKDINEEANRKYDNIIERTNEITGTITDATGLEVGDKGELDGYVIGERGTAHVHTIGAGGYNIQCYHFRVLVHEVR